MKKITSVSLATAAIVLAAATLSCSGDKTVMATAIHLDKTHLVLAIGDTADIKATVEPSNATVKALTWAVRPTGFAQVSNGRVTAQNIGQTSVYATDGIISSEICTIDVLASVVHVTDVALDRDELVVAVGGSQFLRAAVYPANASNQALTWSSSEPSVATAAGGAVLGHRVGAAVITVATQDGNKTDQCIVNVVPEIIYVTGVALDEDSLSMAVDGTARLVATVSPSNATDKRVTWSSSAPAIASVSNDGVVTAHQPGYAIITAETNNGPSAACAVVVTG